jgi:hypothetical protein
MPDPTNIAKLTVDKVIDMFKELGLPVCDDPAQIEARFNEKKRVYLKELQSPVHSIRVHGEDGLKNGDMMLNRRAELLEVVYQHFVTLAEGTRLDLISSGNKPVSQAWVEHITARFGVERCRLSPQLAEAFSQRYMAEKNLVLGDPAAGLPTPVTVFSATPDGGHIRLSWELPADHCDSVQIFRDEIPPEGKPVKPSGKPIYDHTGSSYLDQTAEQGKRYQYRAVSVFYGSVKDGATATAVCVGEARGASARWEAGAARLGWALPGDKVSVILFKRVGAAPEVHFSPGGPRPGADTTRMDLGQAAECSDSELPEGATGFYTLVCDYGSGIFSQGITVQASAPKPPPEPTGLSAVYTRDPAMQMVMLAWPPAPTDTPVNYVLVRREGSVAPARVSDGSLLAVLAETRWTDAGVEPGQRYSYAVFSRAGELDSRDCAVSPPVDILADVTGLVARVSDGAVELEWRAPANTHAVRVTRDESVAVPLTGEGHARDEGLLNGQVYHYRVACVYRPDGLNEVVSAGSFIEAAPERLPDPPQDFSARARGLEVELSWTPPAHGQVVVVRSARPTGLAFGQRLDAAQIDRLGERLVAAEGGRGVDPHPDLEKPFYSIFATAGGALTGGAVAGGAATAVVCPDVTNLRIAASRDGVTLRWTWPPGLKAARVVRRLGAPPAGVDDPQATCVPYSILEYRAAGEKFNDRIENQRGRFFYSVFAQVSSPAGQFFSPGAGEGCRAEIQWEPWMTISYDLVSAPSAPKPGGELLIRWTMLDAFASFAGVVLVASQEGVPQSPDDGIELFRWKPEPGQRDAQCEAPISLAAVQMRRWSRFFCKLMAADPVQRHSVLIVHRNTCLSFAGDGRLEQPVAAAPLDGYRAGVPEEVICPYCFMSFPVEQILFTTPDGSESATVKYGRMDRILKRAFDPPRSRHGQIMTTKKCPNPAQQHVLPYTAGTQSSLIIGLIGAKFSGKSHYIATLIDRLEKQAGADMDASLLPVTDETRDRYRHEFYAPLFKNSLELGATIGAPPPLIYDLSLSGRPWNERQNRAVTLALYDTAGENLENRAVAEQMVQYLGKASGIIFLVDPLQVPSVREMLPGNIQPPELDYEAAPNQIIANVLQLLERGKVIASNAPISVPVAIVLTKCDVLVEAGLIETNRLWSTDKRHIGYYDVQAHNDMTGMMGEYFQRWNRDAYNNIRQRFARHAFFGVSATGCASDKETRRYKFISPWRVEDPLLWLLAELNVIKKG